MNKVETKARVDFRMKPLLHKGVRILYNKAEFSIVDYDFFDSSGTYIINVSDRNDPLEFNLTEMQTFLDSIRRKDGAPIPKFNDDATPIESKKKERRKAAAVPAGIDEEDDVPEEPVMAISEEPVIAKEVAPRKTGQFVHIKSTTEIYVTRDYSLFGMLQGNRSLNKSKIKRIKDEITAGTNLLKYCPIIVVEKEGKLKVIDGQHRLEVAKQIQSNIWYVISNELSLYEIAKMNSNTEKWKGKDFINCYVASGNTSYKILKEFVTVYGFPLTVSLQLLNRGMKLTDGGAEISQAFQEGKFMVRTEDEAIQVGQVIERFEDFAGRKARAFVIAVCKILLAGKISIDDVIKAYAANKDRLAIQVNWKDYLLNLETIVNIGKSKRRVIY